MLYATYTYATDDALLTEARTQSGAGYSLSTFSYDANGNRTLEEKGAQRFTYTWDPANRLTKITQAPGTGGDLTNQYRPDGLRSAGGHAMLWDGFDLLSEIRVSDGQIAPYYTRGNTLLKTRNDVTGNTEWFHLDEQGTRVQTSQTSGLPYPGMSDPGPWGEEPIVVTGAPTGAAAWLADPGYYLEPKLARMLYYVRARWYPAGGPGWVSKDPLWLVDDISGENPYNYAVNRPTRYDDPAGERPRQRPPRVAVFNPFPPRGRRGFAVGYEYGLYCGAANVKNPGRRILPQDCLDACCQIHDRCLEAHYGAGYNELNAHQCCDDDILICTGRVIVSKCCAKSPLGYHKCYRAAGEVNLGMSIVRRTRYKGTPKKPCLSKSTWPTFVREYWGKPLCFEPMGVGSPYMPVKRSFGASGAW